jgi:hypothetical protein
VDGAMVVAMAGGCTARLLAALISGCGGGRDSPATMVESLAHGHSAVHGRMDGWPVAVSFYDHGLMSKVDAPILTTDLFPHSIKKYLKSGLFFRRNFATN